MHVHLITCMYELSSPYLSLSPPLLSLSIFALIVPLASFLLLSYYHHFHYQLSVMKEVLLIMMVWVIICTVDYRVRRGISISIPTISRLKQRVCISHKPVSYTHLTLPTIYSVQISVVAVSLKKKNIYDLAAAYQV
eukprot:TRINITY_DN11414_c0_g1_i11.p2 TRINITY_DN11414_c0_g1~~TRINITY_DN11414_c0_g1_i11.p2  ORF type:complete len:136 (-),score=6.25 TRINITY_DN11414_c0_g1_i11:12-419(-)